MKTFIIVMFIFLLFIGILFGWYSAKITNELDKAHSQKKWLGLAILVIGQVYMIFSTMTIAFMYEYREYDSNKYEVARDTTITNHNGQIDTLSTFKIVKK